MVHYATAAAQALDEANVAAGKATMHALAVDVREAYPEAKVLDLEESDQGDWLTIHRIEDVNGIDIDEGTFDDEWSSCLYTDVWRLRDLYAEYDVRGDIEYSDRMGLRSFRMDIDKVLAELAPAPGSERRVNIEGEYGVVDGSIHLLNADGTEAVMWDSAEWVEDPSLVYVIANAIVQHMKGV